MEIRLQVHTPSYGNSPFHVIQAIDSVREDETFQEAMERLLEKNGKCSRCI